MTEFFDTNCFYSSRPFTHPASEWSQTQSIQANGQKKQSNDLQKAQSVVCCVPHIDIHKLFFSFVFCLLHSIQMTVQVFSMTRFFAQQFVDHSKVFKRDGNHQVKSVGSFECLRMHSCIKLLIETIISGKISFHRCRRLNVIRSAHPLFSNGENASFIKILMNFNFSFFIFHFINSFPFDVKMRLSVIDSTGDY